MDDINKYKKTRELKAIGQSLRKETKETIDLLNNKVREALSNERHITPVKLKNDSITLKQNKRNAA